MKPHACILVFWICLGVLLFWGCEGTEQTKVGPIISRIDPLTAEVGDKVVITGSGFGEDASQIEVLFVDAVASVVSVSHTQIEVLVPERAQSGVVKLRVGDQETTYPHGTFHVQRDHTDVFGVYGIEPLYGEVGTVVTITGSQFGEDKAALGVKFGSVGARISSVKNTEIKTAVPAQATSGNISISKTGEATIIYSTPFTVVQRFGVTSISPLYGEVGAVVTITGSQFGEDKAVLGVSFGRVSAMIDELTNTEIKTAVPAQATTGKIRVIKTGERAVEYSEDFLVLSTSASFAISGISPTEGSTGTVVTITGSGFGNDQGAIVLRFGTKVATITNLKDTEIQTTVPSGAKSAKIIIIKGGVAVGSNDSFTVTSS